MYAITGITGKVGAVVARQLLAAGLPVRAVLRDVAKGPVWAAQGCELALAAMDDEAALTQAFTGAQAVFVLLPPTFDPAPGFTETQRFVSALRGALQATRPQRVVCISTVGAQAEPENLLTQLAMLEKGLGTLALPITFLRPAWFMENVAWDVAGARSSGSIASHLQPLDRAIPMVATEDVGRTAAALLQETWQGRRVVELEGPQCVSPNGIARALSEVLGREVHVQAVPRSTWEAQFRSQGMQHPQPRMRMLDGFNDGWIGFEGQPRQGSVGLQTVLRQLAG